ncbi:histone H3.3-like [Orussus abietinus]|uniref:histone H3.3-like n=1 Tax=Orussus abietinus TaxID=222816 RepID=UPI000626DA31|nr:histone H3.3-like [Orussus abietinus]
MVRRKATASPRSGRSDGSNKGASSEKSSHTVVIVDRNRTKRRTMRVLQEIKHLRRTTRLLIPKAPFARLVREIIRECFPRLDVQRIQVSALEALQEATEMYITQFFEDAMLLTLHAKRVTLMQRDMILMRRLRGRDDIINR